MEFKGKVVLELEDIEGTPKVHLNASGIDYEGYIILISYLMNNVAKTMSFREGNSLQEERDYITSRVYKAMIEMETKDIKEME